MFFSVEKQRKDQDWFYVSVKHIILSATLFFTSSQAVKPKAPEKDVKIEQASAVNGKMCDIFTPLQSSEITFIRVFMCLFNVLICQAF